MIGLLENRFVPLTDTFGFLRCSVEVAASAFLAWQRPLQAKRGVTLKEYIVQGSLETLLKSLLPLTSVERRRFIFLATHSEWTAFVDNGHHGTDAFAPISYLSQTIGCAGVRATDAPSGQNQGGTVFELYSPENTDWLNLERAVSVTFANGRWEFHESGTALPFESPELYRSKLIKDRFDTEMLKQYLGALGVDAFNPEYYTEKGHFIEKMGASAPTMQLFDLAG